jgi:hypothetical protein
MACVIIGGAVLSIADLIDFTETPPDYVEMLRTGEVGQFEGFRIIESPFMKEDTMMMTDRQINRLERSRNPRDQLMARTLKQRRAKGG